MKGHAVSDPEPGGQPPEFALLRPAADQVQMDFHGVAAEDGNALDQAGKTLEWFKVAHCHQPVGRSAVRFEPDLFERQAEMVDVDPVRDPGIDLTEMVPQIPAIVLTDHKDVVGVEHLAVEERRLMVQIHPRMHEHGEGYGGLRLPVKQIRHGRRMIAPIRQDMIEPLAAESPDAGPGVRGCIGRLRDVAATEPGCGGEQGRSVARKGNGARGRPGHTRHGELGQPEVVHAVAGKHAGIEQFWNVSPEPLIGRVKRKDVQLDAAFQQGPHVARKKCIEQRRELIGKDSQSHGWPHCPTGARIWCPVQQVFMNISATACE